MKFEKHAKLDIFIFFFHMSLRLVINIGTRAKEYVNASFDLDIIYNETFNDFTLRQV